MSTIVEQFDSVRITNASIQTFENGTQQTGTKFGLLGSIEGETELREFVKIVEGAEANKITKPVKMNITVSGHIPVAVARDIFGLTNEDLKPGVWAYGANSKGKSFILTADVIDEFQDITKLIAFANCVSNTGLKIQVENAADELAELEIEITVMKDSEGQFYYEAITSEITDETVKTQWHTTFTPELVKAVATP
jgi:hypothetical protein